MSSFYICHCGNVQENHYFKHPFTPTSKISFENNTFTIDKKDFVEKKVDKCSFPNCILNKDLHTSLYSKEFLEELKKTNNGVDITHKFTPQDKSYKEFLFILPENTLCCVCNKNIFLHRKNDQKNHYFTVNVEIVPSGTPLGTPQSAPLGTSSGTPQSAPSGTPLSLEDKLLIQDPEDEDTPITVNLVHKMILVRSYHSVNDMNHPIYK